MQTGPGKCTTFSTKLKPLKHCLPMFFLFPFHISGPRRDIMVSIPTEANTTNVNYTDKRFILVFSKQVLVERQSDSVVTNKCFALTNFLWNALFRSFEIMKFHNWLSFF